MRCFSVFYILLLWLQGLSAQTIERYNSFHYTVDEGMVQSTMYDMVFDDRNYCWISYPVGIQRFDGKMFTNVPIQEGLPVDEAVRFWRTKNGVLLIAHKQGLSVYNTCTEKFRHFFAAPESVRPGMFVGETNERVYFLQDNGNLLSIRKNDLQVKTIISPDILKEASVEGQTSDTIFDNRVVITGNKRLFLVDLEKGQVLHSSPYFPNLSNFFLTMNSADEALYFESEEDEIYFYSYSFSTGQRKLIRRINQPSERKIFRANLFYWNNRAVFSLYNRLYRIDSIKGKITGQLLNYYNSPIPSRTIARIREDNFGNLWLSTISNGIYKIVRNNFPVQYYGLPKPDSSYVLSIVADKPKNRILAGTLANGLLVFDTTGILILHVSRLPGSREKFDVLSVVKAPDGYYLFCKDVWKVSADFRSFTKLKMELTGGVRNSLGYFMKPILVNDTGAIVLSQNKQLRVNFRNATVRAMPLVTGYPLSGLFYNDHIYTFRDDKLVCLDPQTNQTLWEKYIPGTGDVRSFINDATGNIYLGTNRGVVCVTKDGQVKSRWTRESGLPDECIYAMAFDARGNLWCSSNRGIFKIDKNNNVLQMTADDGLQQNEFNTNVVAASADCELFFGGVRGINSFYPATVGSYKDAPTVMITGIKVNNRNYLSGSSLCELDKLILPYNRNSLSIDFTAMGSSAPDQYNYQYRMSGLEGDWVNAGLVRNARYYLPPGTYHFQLFASRGLGGVAQPMRDLVIVIRPPFWNTWWFRSLAALLLVAGIIIVINRRNRHRYEEKLRVLENERQINLERERISKDLHDSLGVYAHAVLHTAEKMEGEKDGPAKDNMVKDVKFASKSIITSLREAVWALKKDAYSAEECLIRVRNFIQPLSKHYSAIQFSVTGEAPEQMLHSTDALNLVRIIQEAVTNSIKHANPSTIQVISSIAGAQWKIEIHDDGRGFSTSTPVQGRGNGLFNMRQRAKDSNFSLSLTSAPQDGTSVVIII